MGDLMDTIYLVFFGVFLGFYLILFFVLLFSNSFEKKKRKSRYSDVDEYKEEAFDIKKP